VTVAFGGLGVPMTAMSGKVISISPLIENRAAAPAKILRPPVMTSSAPPLRLFSETTRQRFVSTGIILDHFVLDTAKEEFFRTEVPYGSLIYREAMRNNLPPEFVAAVVKTESDFRPRLCSTKNAQGLMQLIPSTGELMGATDLFNPAENVRAGTRYLRYLTERFQGNTTLILAAYNAGESTVRRYGGVPPFPETTQYLQRVSRSTREYEQRFSEHLLERYTTGQLGDVAVAAAQ
jgi:hypothetical protein